MGVMGGKRVAELGVLGEHGRCDGGRREVAGRACPAPTGWCGGVRTRGAREGGSPPPLQWAGGCPGMDGDARPVGIPQSPNGDSPL